MVQENLSKYINEMGFKKKSIADGVGMTEMAFYSSMKGERKLSAEEFEKICDFLCKPMDTFR